MCIRDSSKSVSPSTNTNYTIASLTDANCSSIITDLSGSTTVSVNARPTANITSANSTICEGASTNITGNVIAAGAWTLTLSNGAGTCLLYTSDAADERSSVDLGGRR